MDVFFQETAIAFADRSLVAGMQPFGARAHLVLSPLGIAHLERFEVDSAGLRFVDRIQEKRQLLHVGPAARAAYRRIDEDDTVYGICMLVRKPGRDPRPQRMTHHGIPLELERGRERGDIGRIGIQRVVQIRTGLGQPPPTKVQHKRIAQAPEAFADEVPGRGTFTAHAEKTKGLPIGKPLVMLARPERFELPTPWFVAKYSIQLSYGREGADYSRTGAICESAIPMARKLPIIRGHPLYPAIACPAPPFQERRQ